MEDFYWIVLVVAAVILILSMTFIGVVMYTSTSSAVFPPRANACPDYWAVGDDSGKVTCDGSAVNQKNLGNLSTTAAITSATPTDARKSASAGVIYSADTSWANAANYPGKTGFCAKQAWAVNNGITWDGVSNSNVC